MKVPRFRTAWGMVLVAMVALNFGAIRASFGFEPYVAQALLLGVLPMANVLAVGILLGRRRPEIRPFLLGFEAFGVIALALCVAVAGFFPDGVTLCLMLIEALLEKTIGRHTPFIFALTVCIVAVVMLGLPQVAFALFGGSLTRRYRIARRPPRTP